MPVRLAAEALHQEVHQRPHFRREMADVGMDGVHVDRLAYTNKKDR